MKRLGLAIALAALMLTASANMMDSNADFSDDYEFDDILGDFISDSSFLSTL